MAILFGAQKSDDRQGSPIRRPLQAAGVTA
jgi:hypothetical protein